MCHVGRPKGHRAAGRALVRQRTVPLVTPRPHGVPVEVRHLGHRDRWPLCPFSGDCLLRPTAFSGPGPLNVAAYRADAVDHDQVTLGAGGAVDDSRCSGGVVHVHAARLGTARCRHRAAGHRSCQRCPRARRRTGTAAGDHAGRLGLVLQHARRFLPHEQAADADTDGRGRRRPHVGRGYATGKGAMPTEHGPRTRATRVQRGVRLPRRAHQRSSRRPRTGYPDLPCP